MIRILIILLFISSTAFGQRQFFTLGKPAAITVITYDTDAQNYITAVEAAGRSLSLDEKSYINTYVVGLKAAGIWTKIYDRILPIWGSAAPSLIGLKGVVTFAAIGSPSFTSSGVDFNGTSQYITTGVSPSTYASTSSAHLSYYSQDDITATMVDMGSSQSTSRFAQLILVTTTGQIGRAYTSANQAASARAGGSAGMASLNRVATNDLRIFWNGPQTGSTATGSVGTLPSTGIYIGAENDDGVAVTFSSRKCSMASFGGGKTVAEEADDFTLTEAFMDSMGIGVVP